VEQLFAGAAEEEREAGQVGVEVGEAVGGVREPLQ
jgi:hypothetical protein